MPGGRIRPAPPPLMPPAEPAGLADLVREALRCEKAGDLAAAARLLDQALDGAPDDGPALAAAARVAGRRGDRATVLTCLRRLVERDPKHKAHRLDLAIALFGAGDLVAAEQQAQVLLAQDPREGRALNLLGVVQRRQGRLDAAIATLEQAARSGAAGESPWVNLGNLFYENRDGARAVEAFKKAVKLKPKDAEIARLLGNAHALAGDPTAAFATFQRAAFLNPRHVQIHADRAALHYNLKQYDEALAALERALAGRPDEVHFHINKAKVLRHLA